MVGGIKDITADTIWIILYCVILSIIIFSCPFAERLFFQNNKKKAIYLIGVYAILVASDFVLYQFNRYSIYSPCFYRSRYCFYIKEAILSGIFVIAIWTIWEKGTRNIEKAFVSFSGILTMLCLVIINCILRDESEGVFRGSKESVYILIIELSILFLLFLCPLVDYFTSVKVQKVYLVFSGIATLVGDVLLFILNGKVFPHENLYYWILKIAITMFLVFFIIYTLKIKQNLHEVTFKNSIFPTLVFIIIICLIFIMFCLKGQGLWLWGNSNVRTIEITY